MNKELQLEHERIRWNEELFFIVIYNDSNCETTGGVKLHYQVKEGSNNPHSSPYVMQIRGA